MYGNYHSRILLVVLVMSIMNMVFPDDAGAWSWKLDPKLYQQLDVFQRNQYQKAEELFNSKQYKLGAIEFDLFTRQYDDSPALSAAFFMMGMCQQQGLERNTAIKTYKQVLDFFPDDANYASASQFYIGQCMIDNGDVQKGMKEMKAMVAHKLYSQHPLAANALDLLADNSKKNNMWPEYYRYGTQLYTDFYNSNRGLADKMRDEMTCLYIKDQAYSKIEELVAKHNWKDPINDAGYHYWLWDRAYHTTFASYYTPVEEKDRQDDIAKFWTYWTTKSLPVTRKNSVWDSNWRSLNFYLRYKRAAKDEWTKLLGDMVNDQTQDDQLRNIIQVLMDNNLFDDALPLTSRIKNVQAFLPWFFNKLIERNKLDHAEHVLGQMESPSDRLWYGYILNKAKGNWKECIKQLTELANNDENRARQANDQLVWVYMDQTKQYDEAVKLLQVIADPPRTTFLTAECYRRGGQMDKAIGSLSEIENFFPDQAPEAVWRMVQIFEQFGARDKAIKSAKHGIKDYPKAPQVSLEHEYLERLGIATGLNSDQAQGQAK